MEDVTIDKITIDVSANTSDAESNLKRLEQLVSNLKGLQKTADSASKNVNSATSATNKTPQVGSVITKLNQLQKKIDGAAQNTISALNGIKLLSTFITRLNALQKKVAVSGFTGGGSTGNGKAGNRPVSEQKPISPKTKTADGEKPALRAESSSLARYQKFLDALSVSANNMKAKFLSAIPSVKKFGSALLNVATMPIRKYFNGITSGFTKLVDGIRHKIALIKRMAMLKLFRLAFQGIIDGIKEANDNLYKYSQSIDSALYKSRDKIYSASKYASNSLAAMTAPLINALAPAIDFVIGKMVDLMNMFNQFVASLTGADTWTKAVKQQLSYGDSLDKSDKKANKLKRTLMGFDELNLLNGNNDTSSDDMAYKGMFEEVKVDSSNGLSNFVDSLKRKVQEQDWYGLGQLLAEKFNSAFENVNTEAVGVKLGNKINALIDTANGFLENAHFVDLGKKLSDFVNGSITTIKWDNAGRLFANGLTSILDIAIGFLSNLKVDKVIDALVGFVSGALTKFGEWLKKTEWKPLIENIQNGIQKGLSDKNATKLANGVSDLFIGLFDAAGEILNALKTDKLLETLGDWVGKLVTNIKWGEIGTSFWDNFGQALVVGIVALPDVIGKNVSAFLSGLFGGLGMNSIAGFFDGLREEAQKKIDNVKTTFDIITFAVKNHLKIFSPSRVFAELGSYTMLGFIDGVKSKVEEAKTTFTTFIDGIKNKFSQANSNIETNTKTKWDNIKSTIKSALDTIKNWFSGLKLQLPHIKLPHFKLEGSFSLDPPSVPKIGIDWYAKGGFPNEGQLFVAREAGAEMVGSIGGRTAVANNQDIVTAVSKGVYSAVKDAMSGNGNAPVTVNLVVDGEVFYETIVSRNRNETYRTGSNPLLA